MWVIALHQQIPLHRSGNSHHIAAELCRERSRHAGHSGVKARLAEGHLDWRTRSAVRLLARLQSRLVGLRFGDIRLPGASDSRRTGPGGELNVWALYPGELETRSSGVAVPGRADRALIGGTGLA